MTMSCQRKTPDVMLIMIRCLNVVHRKFVAQISVTEKQSRMLIIMKLINRPF